MSRDWQEQLQLEQEHEEQQIADGIANLHEEEALKIHKEETDAINDKRNQDKAVA
tara:strand:+ start:160 stop:324 length:165 start_codon:yes stop_codon:yes gene_type:complete